MQNGNLFLETEKKRKTSVIRLNTLRIISSLLLIFGILSVCLSFFIQEVLLFYGIGLFLMGVFILCYSFLRTLFLKKKLKDENLPPSLFEFFFPSGTFDVTNKFSFSDLRNVKVVPDFNFLNSSINFGGTVNNKEIKIANVELKNTNNNKLIFNGLIAEVKTPSSYLKDDEKLLIKTPGTKCIMPKILKEIIIDVKDYGNTFVTFTNAERLTTYFDHTNIKKELIEYNNRYKSNILIYMTAQKCIIMIPQTKNLIDPPYGKIKLTDSLAKTYQDLYSTLSLIQYFVNND